MSYMFDEYTLSDLKSEIKNFDRKGFKFWSRILLNDVPEKFGNHIIYGEIIPIKEEEIEDINKEQEFYKSTYEKITTRLEYDSNSIPASKILDFIEYCENFQQCQYKSKKERKNLVQIFK